jgi:hypothetical protein
MILSRNAYITFFIFHPFQKATGSLRFLHKRRCAWLFGVLGKRIFASMQATRTGVIQIKSTFMKSFFKNIKQMTCDVKFLFARKVC